MAGTTGNVDADIEGLAHDAGIDRFVAEMAAAGIAPRQRIERLKAYVRARCKADKLAIDAFATEHEQMIREFERKKSRSADL